MEETTTQANAHDISQMIATALGEIDSLSTGQEARALHDFVQDRMMPILKAIVDHFQNLEGEVAYAMEAIEQSTFSDRTQLTEEHATVLKAFIEESIAFVQQIMAAAEQAKAPEEQLQPLRLHVEKGRGLVSFIDDVTLTEEDEEEEEPAANAN